MSGSFTNIGNLTGGAGDDSFVLADAGSLTGSIAGGGQTTSDTLNLSAKLGAVSIDQQTTTATGIAGTFGGIEAVVGNGVNATLTGADAGETFTVTAADAGTAGSLAFSGIGNLTGGAGDDSFVLADAGSLTGSIAGGGQTTSDTLNLSAKLGAVSINQQTDDGHGHRRHLRRHRSGSGQRGERHADRCGCGRDLHCHRRPMPVRPVAWPSAASAT